MEYCVLLAPLKKCRWPRRSEHFLTLPGEVGSADHYQMDQFLLLDAAIEKLGIGKPRSKIPRTFIEREAESVICVAIDQFIHLNCGLLHPDQSDILCNCAGMGLEHSGDLRRQTQANMSTYSRCRLK